MVVAVTAKGAGLGAWVDDDFAHCGFVVIVYDTGRFEAYPNPAARENTLGMLVDFICSLHTPPDCLVTAAIDPEALGALSKAGITVYIAKKGSVLELAEAVASGTLPAAGAEIHRDTGATS